MTNNDNNSTLISRNITIFDRRTSVRLEPEMWKALHEISVREGCTIHDISSLIAIRKNEKTSLTAAIRVFIMLYFRAGCTEEGHQRARHGNFNVMKQRARIPEEYEMYFKAPRRQRMIDRMSADLPNYSVERFESNAVSGLKLR